MTCRVQRVFLHKKQYDCAQRFGFCPKPRPRPLHRDRDGAPHERDRRVQIAHDEGGIRMKHAVPERLKPGIPPRIRLLPLGMIAAVKLNDRRTVKLEIHDALAEDDLPAELRAELSASDGRCPPTGGARKPWLRRWGWG